MPRDQDQTPLHEATVLRRRAEVHLKTKTPEVDFSRSDGEARRLLHELQVHQIELVMQNVELRQARDQIEKSLEKYTDLYDFAPVGYVTLDRDGTIGSANLTVATLLGIERSRMLGQRFSRFVATEARPAFTVFLGKIFTVPVKEVCEVAF
jgi:PAS domain-containing protein